MVVAVLRLPRMSGEICSSNNGQHSQFRNIDLYYRPVDSHDLDLRLSHDIIALLLVA